jgi:hypothetical protein
MNGRRGYPMPQGGAGYNPYSKYPDIAGLVEKFMQNMMMQKQMKQQQQQQMWQRGMEEQKMESLETHRQAQREEWQESPKPSALPARVQEAIMATDQGGIPHEEINWKPVGMKLDKWRAKPEKEEIDLDNKYKQRKNLMKSLRTRLSKEVTTLKQRSKPLKLMKAEGEEFTAGELTLMENKDKAARQLANIENALNFLGRMESSLEKGVFGKRQSEALSRMMGNIGKLREGILLDDLSASWAKELESTPQALQAPTRKQFRNKKTGKLDWFVLKGGNWIKE